METTNFPNKTDTATGAPANIAGRVGNAAANVLDATKAAGKQIGSVASQEMSNLKADLDELISRIPSLSEVDLNAAKEKLLAKIESTKVAAKGVTTEVKQQLNHGVDVTSDYVKERPIQSVAIAAGIGILLGMLIARR